jgi:hypothetical protein
VVQSQRVFTIAKIEADKEYEDAQKVKDRHTLTEAKKLGKEPYAAVKARLT